MRRAAAVNAHGGFLRIVTSLTRPVSALHPRLPCERELAKIFDFCLRDSTEGTIELRKSNVKWYAPIAPDRRELSPQVTEGASGQ